MLVFSSEEIKSSVSMVDAIECVAKGFSDFDDGIFSYASKVSNGYQWSNGFNYALL